LYFDGFAMLMNHDVVVKDIGCRFTLQALQCSGESSYVHCLQFLVGLAELTRYAWEREVTVFFIDFIGRSERVGIN